MPITHSRSDYGFIGFVDVKQQDIFSIAGIIGAVVMPHNLYLHSGDLKARSFGIKQSPDAIDSAAFWCTIDPIFPIMVSFFINLGESQVWYILARSTNTINLIHARLSPPRTSGCECGSTNSLWFRRRSQCWTDRLLQLLSKSSQWMPALGGG